MKTIKNKKIIILITLAVVILAGLLAARFIPVYSDTAAVCGDNTKERKSILRGDSKSDVEEKVRRMDEANGMILCTPLGGHKIELYVF